MFFVVMDMLTRISENANGYISKNWEIALWHIITDLVSLYVLQTFLKNMSNNTRVEIQLSFLLHWLFHVSDLIASFSSLLSNLSVMEMVLCHSSADWLMLFSARPLKWRWTTCGH